MAQRYFITAESTYENLRQGLNEQLGYPNSLGKTIIQTALQAPRDGFRRVLLAIDTDLPNYAAIAAAIAPLLDSDAMEEIDEATYLAAVASATAGASSWNDITGKPTEFPPLFHTHSAADITGLATIATSGSASDLGAGTVPFARLPVGQTSTTVAVGNDARFTDARTPTGTAGGDLTGTYPNPQIAAGAVVTADLADGAVTTAKLANSAVTVAKVSATGTPSASTFLRGDGAWASAGSTSASDLTTGTLANARLTTRARAAINTYLWSAFR